MTLGEKQREFTLKIAHLIMWAYENDMELSFGEAYRTPEQAALNAEAGTGIRNSLHTKRLAVDLNLYLDVTPGGDEDIYQMGNEAYRLLGEQWERMGGTWGGRFGDGNHFSFEHEGVK